LITLEEYTLDDLRVGIACHDELKALTMAVARSRRELTAKHPRVWFPSTESFDELAQLAGRKKSNLSRTLKTMANYGLVQLHRGPRGRIAPKVIHDRIELELPLVRKEHAALRATAPSRPPSSGPA
jgi:predicted transcriptional regulator